MAEEKRQWQPREMRMVSEFLAQHYSKYPTKTRVRVGSIHADLKPGDLSEAEQRMVGVLCRAWLGVVVGLTYYNY